MSDDELVQDMVGGDFLVPSDTHGCAAVHPSINQYSF